MAAKTKETAPILDLEKLKGDRRRREWVTLPRLGRVCVRELLMSEAVQIADYSTRPAEDPRGGTDREESSLWQIAFTSYDGDGPDAKRLFDDHQVHLIRSLTLEEFTLLMQAINRVNGLDATEVELVRDFTGAPPGRPPSD
jgi:hypothetical protein